MPWGLVFCNDHHQRCAPGHVPHACCVICKGQFPSSHLLPTTLRIDLAVVFSPQIDYPLRFSLYKQNSATLSARGLQLDLAFVCPPQFEILHLIGALKTNVCPPGIPLRTWPRHRFGLCFSTSNRLSAFDLSFKNKAFSTWHPSPHKASTSIWHLFFHLDSISPLRKNL